MSNVCEHGATHFIYDYERDQCVVKHIAITHASKTHAINQYHEQKSKLSSRHLCRCIYANHTSYKHTFSAALCSNNCHLS